MMILLVGNEILKAPLKSISKAFGVGEPKSAHMRFVHSRCHLGLFLGGYVLDRRCDLRCIIELGECVLPWSMLLHMPLDVLDQVAEAFSPVVACAFVMDIAEDPLNRIGTWTVRR